MTAMRENILLIAVETEHLLLRLTQSAVLIKAIPKEIHGVNERQIHMHGGFYLFWSNQLCKNEVTLRFAFLIYYLLVHVERCVRYPAEYTFLLLIHVQKLL